MSYRVHIDIERKEDSKKCLTSVVLDTIASLSLDCGVYYSNVTSFSNDKILKIDFELRNEEEFDNSTYILDSMNEKLKDSCKSLNIYKRKVL